MNAVDILSTEQLRRCPFVRAVADGRLAVAAELAARPPDPATGPALDWLVTEARRQLELLA